VALRGSGGMGRRGWVPPRVLSIIDHGPSLFAFHHASQFAASTRITQFTTIQVVPNSYQVVRFTCGSTFANPIRNSLYASHTARYADNF
jgi:hypothetical protein